MVERVTRMDLSITVHAYWVTVMLTARGLVSQNTIDQIIKFYISRIFYELI